MDEIEDFLMQLTLTSPLIDKLKMDNPNGGLGIDSCPICNKKIHWCVSSYNGHISLKCETKDCVNMME